MTELGDDDRAWGQSNETMTELQDNGRAEGRRQGTGTMTEPEVDDRARGK